ncbi:MAG: tetratricopeptide repeat protein [Xanthobacteraceae bacterium]|nr:tetratricopeptide repeat protein [Xanthobacteraceae bacterium]
MASDTFSALLGEAIQLHDRGQLREAEQRFRKILAGNGRHFGALCRLGLLHLQRSQFKDAERLFRRALKADSQSAEAHQFMGFALTGLGRYDEAVLSYRAAIAIKPAFTEATNNLGFALQASGQLEQAAIQYQNAIALRPGYHEAHNNLGNVLHLLNRPAEAISRYRTALEIAPGYAEAHWNLGNALRGIGHFEDAISCYEEAIALRPTYPEAFNSLGNTLRALGRGEDAVARFRQALALKPDYTEARLNLGEALTALHREDEAIAEFTLALTDATRRTDALTRRADALARLHRDRAAIADYEAALAIDPGHGLAFDGLARSAAAICDWERTLRLQDKLPEWIAAGRGLHPMNGLGYSADPALQRRCAELFAREVCPEAPPALCGSRGPRNGKLRIAYVACGYHAHPTAYLTAGLIETHDRSRFEVIGISLGPDDGSEIRARLARGFDRFHDVRATSDRGIADLINELEVDIAVDRSGYTTNARPWVFALRPAPIQVNFIGFPGTLGAAHYDYIIGDATVTPLEQEACYSERIVQLPHSYLVTDRRRPIDATPVTRAQENLPETGFVFCCFNDCYKITPPMFDIWMRLLGQVDGSVLWLLGGHPEAETNLRHAAAVRGIDPGRLVFAGRVAVGLHLARHRLADLFLDTLPYNAHTTAADALWSGLPLVTCRGQAFAGRVAASLLQAIGLAELITDDLAGYEKLSLALAREPGRLRALRERLAINRASFPLFDTERYCRHLEAAYLRMRDVWRLGNGPEALVIEA